MPGVASCVLGALHLRVRCAMGVRWLLFQGPVHDKAGLFLNGGPPPQRSSATRLAGDRPILLFMRRFGARWWPSAFPAVAASYAFPLFGTVPCLGGVPGFGTVPCFGGEPCLSTVPCFGGEPCFGTVPCSAASPA